MFREMGDKSWRPCSSLVPRSQAPPSPAMLALTWEGISGPVGATVRSCWEKFIICLGQPKGRVGLYLFELILSRSE